MTSVRIEVPGLPATKGSARAYTYTRADGTKGARVENDAGSKARAWEYAVGLLARQAMRGEQPMDGPVCMRVVFMLPRPKTVKRETPSVKPDLDKLIRCMCDPMTGIVWGDDAQVVRVEASKVYAQSHEQPGAVVIVTREETT